MCFCECYFFNLSFYFSLLIVQRSQPEGSALAICHLFSRMILSSCVRVYVSLRECFFFSLLCANGANVMFPFLFVFFFFIYWNHLPSSYHVRGERRKRARKLRKNPWPPEGLLAASTRRRSDGTAGGSTDWVRKWVSTARIISKNRSEGTWGRRRRRGGWQMIKLNCACSHLRMLTTNCS